MLHIWVLLTEYCRSACTAPAPLLDLGTQVILGAVPCKGRYLGRNPQSHLLLGVLRGAGLENTGFSVLAGGSVAVSLPDSARHFERNTSGRWQARIHPTRKQSRCNADKYPGTRHAPSPPDTGACICTRYNTSNVFIDPLTTCACLPAHAIAGPHQPARCLVSRCPVSTSQADPRTAR
jgi:hypothetical protein